MGGGGSSGGSTGSTVEGKGAVPFGSIMYRQWPFEQKQLTQGYDWQTGQYNDFVNQNPLLNAAQGDALKYNQGLDSLLSQFPGFQNQLSGYSGQLGDLFNQVGSQASKYQGQLGGLFSELGGLTTGLGGQQAQVGKYLSTVNPIIMSQGALTPELQRQASQQARLAAEQTGTLGSAGALSSEVLNSDQARQARYNNALQQGQGLQGLLGQLTGERAGLVGQQAGITGQQSGIGQAGFGLQSGLLGQRAGLTGQQAGLLGQQQGLQTGGLNQLLGVGNAGTGQFATLQNPILQYLSNMFAGNQSASVAGANIAGQQQIASNASKGSTTGGIASGVGSIIGAVLPMLAMSDERIKTKVKSTGLKTEDDIPIKTFEYKTKPGTRFVGFMAQDVERKRPDAVFTDTTSGLKLLGVEFAPIKVKEA